MWGWSLIVNVAEPQYHAKMAKSTRGRRGITSRQCRPSPYPLPSHHGKNCSKTFKKDWEDATCSVCMECPHNAVLLLCSSYEKGCRPYMCGTSFRYSNCLDQYKKAYTKAEQSGILLAHDSHDDQLYDPFSAELACPLCRGQVKGWTIVDPAREHLNAKRRSCMQDGCSFIGTFKELRKHVKAEHPCAKPREVDSTLEQKWRRLERERERDDVLSTIRSSTPGAVFFGDYVIEGNNYSDDDDDDREGGDFNGDARIDRNLMSVFLFLQAFGSAGNLGTDRGHNNAGAFDFSDDGSDDGNGDENGGSLVGHLRRQGRVISGRSGRSRRHGEASNGGRR